MIRYAITWTFAGALIALSLRNVTGVALEDASRVGRRSSGPEGAVAMMSSDGPAARNAPGAAPSARRASGVKPPDAARVEAAIEAGARRLRALQREDGTWNTRITYDDAYSAFSVIALNYLGVAGVQADHEALMKRYLSRMHPGGGFSLTPGDPPSKGASSIIQLALTTMRDAGVSQRHRLELDDAIARTERFIARGEAHPEVESYLLSGPAGLLWDTVYPRHSDRAVNLPLLASLNISILSANLPKSLGAPVFDYSQPVYTLLSLRQSHDQSSLSSWLDKLVGTSSERALEKRLLESQEPNGAWWYSTMMTAMHAMALKREGHGTDDPAIKRAVAYLLASRTHQHGILMEDHNDSSLWDTALMVKRLGYATGQPLDNLENRVLPRIIAGGRGDGSYSFSLRGRVPDNDDTASVLSMLAGFLRSVGPATRAEVVAQIRASTGYLLKQRHLDGGFGTWRGNVGVFHGATSPDALKSVVFDGSSPGITSRVLQALDAAQRSGVLTDELSDKVGVALDEGLDYLRNVASKDGTWWSRWVLGRLAAFQCVPVLMRVHGVSPDAPLFVRGREFLLSHQNRDGGWGERAVADRDVRAAGRGPSTAVQTAWAVVGLIAVAHADDDQARRSLEMGIAYLLSRERDGDWSSGRQLFTLYSGLSYYEAPEWDNADVLAALRMYQDYVRVGPAAAVRGYMLGGRAS
jgi:squalene cyclase